MMRVKGKVKLLATGYDKSKRTMQVSSEHWRVPCGIVKFERIQIDEIRSLGSNCIYALVLREFAQTSNVRADSSNERHFGQIQTLFDLFDRRNAKRDVLLVTLAVALLDRMNVIAQILGVVLFVQLQVAQISDVRRRNKHRVEKGRTKRSARIAKQNLLQVSAEQTTLIDFAFANNESVAGPRSPVARIGADQLAAAVQTK